MSELLSVAEAQRQLLSAFESLNVETVPITKVVGRVLAEPVIAASDIPSFDNSSMDGFAVRTTDVHLAAPGEGVALNVVGDIPAGRYVDVKISEGQAARIMTGAHMPAGAEAVVPVENTDFNARLPGIPAPATVRVFSPVKAGENVRPRGQDVRAGETVLPAGLRLRPQDIGFLAMLGVVEVRVHRLPKVAIFSTGDELVPVGGQLSPGKIHDSNSYTLIAQIERYGGEAISLGIVRDDLRAVKSCLDQALDAGVDLIISTAGVSVGAFDFVRHVVENEGRLDFWRVNMRPGKPLAFGSYRGVPYIGLPGNPVSAFIGCEVFVRLAVMKMAGMSTTARPVRRVKVLDTIESDGRESYLRAIVSSRDGEWQARLTGHQGSGNLRSLVQANALLLVPSGVKSLPSGAELDAWLLDDL
jgi:molybdopterin molybdotransferase